ncbi:MAG: helix-turn-helix transcriptional regulator [Lachnospiraceae bacterium]|nr:helix-turn-helix transcriptional regulator [Lachnospiraceae bacterium]
MHSLTFHEQTQHGTLEFPVDYHYLIPGHPRYHMPFHWHKEWEIIHVIKGTFIAYADDVEYTAHSGDCLLIRDGMLHGGTPDDCIYECFLFDLHGLYRSLDIVKKYLRPFYRRQILPDIYYPGDKTPEVNTIITELTESFRQSFHTEATNKSLHTVPDSGILSGQPLELITIGCLSRLFAFILNHKTYMPSQEDTADNTRKIDLVKSVLEYIETHYAAPITLEDLAKEAGMNPKYFCRFFRSITHQTPMSYVNMYRIKRASQMLLETTLPIITIGMECGYNDSSNFIKVFRKYKGMTPNQYRRQ